MLIMILFHDSGYRCFKHFYLEKVCKHLRHLFPKVVSYNRLVELEREVAVPLTLFIKKVLLGKCTGISFVDSTPLRVCKNQRIHIHKVFKGIAQRGKCSMGWFFGFKLHLICNEKGELLNFRITPGDVDGSLGFPQHLDRNARFLRLRSRMNCLYRQRLCLRDAHCVCRESCRKGISVVFRR